MNINMYTLKKLAKELKANMNMFSHVTDGEINMVNDMVVVYITFNHTRTRAIAGDTFTVPARDAVAVLSSTLQYYLSMVNADPLKVSLRNQEIILN